MASRPGADSCELKINAAQAARATLLGALAMEAGADFGLARELR